jgi:hypothetical protein
MLSRVARLFLWVGDGLCAKGRREPLPRSAAALLLSSALYYQLTPAFDAT